MMTKLAVVALLAFVALLLVACSGDSHFVPGVSPTVTPTYNPEGTPSMPVVITSDLPEGWRWQFSRGFPIPDRDVWLLLDDDSGIVGAVGNAGDNCWIVLGDDLPGRPPCYDRDEVGRYAIEMLITNAEPAPAPASAVEPKTLLGVFRAAFTPDVAEEHQVHQVDDGSFVWAASVHGSGLYQITECPPDEIAPSGGMCVRGQLSNTTKYTMTGVQAVCDGNGDEKTPPMQVSNSMQPGASASWVWVRFPIVEPYSCEITWTASQ
ncbi:MAG: hypothetical protein F4X64_08690 [Chloroflexi bacterium]|nr:hypothetical protein [Chloroflexota bacterium]